MKTQITRALLLSRPSQGGSLDLAALPGMRNSCGGDNYTQRQVNNPFIKKDPMFRIRIDLDTDPDPDPSF